MQYRITTLEEIDQIAEQFFQDWKEHRVFLFDAEMGMGKTTFINALCRVMVCKDETSSPTYSLVNEYQSDQGLIYHMDLYRIEDESEAFDAGIEEYLYSNHYCFIEWPSKIETLLPEKYVKVFINLEDNNIRLLTVNANE